MTRASMPTPAARALLAAWHDMATTADWFDELADGYAADALRAPETSQDRAEATGAARAYRDAARLVRDRVGH